MSLPSSSGVMPAAMAAAAPPDDPPAVRRRVPRVVGAAEDVVVGLEVAGVEGGVGLAEDDGAGRLEAADRQGVAWSGTWSLSSGAPEVVTRPSVSYTSFTVMGRPWSTPAAAPLAVASSAAAAAARARSTSRVTIAFSAGLRCSTCARRASSTSRLEICFSRRASVSSVVVAEVGSMPARYLRHAHSRHGPKDPRIAPQVRPEGASRSGAVTVLHFRPDPHGQGSFRPGRSTVLTGC